MSTRSELEFLDYVQDEAELMADEAEVVLGMDRREFVFISLVTAAASTFGFGARALAQADAPAQAPQPHTSPATRQRRSGVVDVPAVSRRHGRAHGEARARARGRPRSSARRSPCRPWTGRGA